MSNYIGGYVLVPMNQEASLTDIARIVSDNLMVTPRFGFPPDAVEAAKTITQLLASIERVRQGSANFLIGGVPSLCIFDTLVGPYNSVNISVDEARFNRFSPFWNPATLDTFAAGWAQVCEEVQADYGYFSPYNLMAYDEYLQEDVLPTLASGDAKYLIEAARAAYWLSYHSPRLVQQWPEPAVVASIVNPDVALTTMPSGAIFLRNDTQKPINT